MTWSGVGGERARLAGAFVAAIVCAGLIAVVLRLSPPAEPTAVRFQTLWLPGVPAIWIGAPLAVVLGWLLGPLTLESRLRSTVTAVVVVLLGGTLAAYLLAVAAAANLGGGLDAVRLGLDPAVEVLGSLVLWLGPYLVVAALAWSFVIRWLSGLGARSAVSSEPAATADPAAPSPSGSVDPRRGQMEVRRAGRERLLDFEREDLLGVIAEHAREQNSR